MGKTRFYTVKELMDMGSIRRDTTIDSKNQFKDQLVIADAISYNMLFAGKPKEPKNKANEDKKEEVFTGQLPLFTLGLRIKDGKGNR